MSTSVSPSPRAVMLLTLLVVCLTAGALPSAIAAPAEAWPTQPGALTAGAYHTCGITDDGSALCWGHNTYGQANPPEGVTFTSLSAGTWHTCGLTDDGTARCWGSHAPAPADATFASLTAGSRHTCGITTDGVALCWGDNRYGQTAVPAGVTFTSLAAGNSYTCGILDDGTARCWGHNWFGQADAPEGITFTSLTADGHTCGITAEGPAMCWGYHAGGKTTVPEGVAFTSLIAGGYRTCGITTHGTARCWGIDWAGETEVPEGHAFTNLATGDFHTCGITDDGRALCWGAEKSSFDHGQTDAPLGVRFGADILAPEITSTVDGVTNQAGWHSAPVTIDYACTDNYGEVNCPAQVIVDQDGADQQVTGTAADLAGNTSSVTDVVNLDQTAPTIEVLLSTPANEAGWHNGPVEISFICADQVSGVTECAPPVAVDEDGADQQVSGDAADAAGNTATTTTTVSLDTQAPITVLTPETAGSRLSGTITDSLSGGARVTIVLTSPLGLSETLEAEADCGALDARVASAALPLAEATCTWSTDAPAGVWQVTLSGTDAADNSEAPKDAGLVAVTP